MQVGGVSPKSAPSPTDRQGQRVRCENRDFCLQIGDLPIGKKFSKVPSLIYFAIFELIIVYKILCFCSIETRYGTLG